MSHETVGRVSEMGDCMAERSLTKLVHEETVVKASHRLLAASVWQLNCSSLTKTVFHQIETGVRNYSHCSILFQ